MDFKDIKFFFIDGLERVVLEKRLTSLPLHEKVILRKSVEFFDDPNPCMLHRSAVMKRIYMEIADWVVQYFDSQNTEVKLHWGEMPEGVKGYVDIDSSVQSVIIKHRK